MVEETCAECGTPASPGARYCEACGTPLAAAPLPAEEAAAQPASPYAVSRVATPYQGVAIRFVALLIDIVILGIINGIVTFPFQSGVSVDTATGAITIAPVFYAGIALSFVIELIYYTLLLGRYGQSVGKMIVKIKVVREADLGPISYGAAFVRTILLVIDAIPYVIPYLLGAIVIWTSDKKQRLGDRVARTVVVRV